MGIGKKNSEIIPNLIRYKDSGDEKGFRDYFYSLSTRELRNLNQYAEALSESCKHVLNTRGCMGG